MIGKNSIASVGCSSQPKEFDNTRPKTEFLIEKYGF